MQQAQDFSDECEALITVLEAHLLERDQELFRTVTQFKNWTINDVIGHLHMFNVAARIILEDGAAFDSFYKPVAQALSQGRSMLEAQYVWLDGLSDHSLFEAWKEECARTAKVYGQADPSERVKWAGPDMSARSSITARQMETWAHGQEIFDCLSATRAESDRIKNIAHLGVNTFGWTFINRGLDIPEPAPHVVLVSPSGATWTWNEDQADNRVEGSATEFCQVVAQTRNLRDTNIKTRGKTAETWMTIAQCFAGPAENPPPPGTRHIVRREKT